MIMSDLAASTRLHAYLELPYGPAIMAGHALILIVVAVGSGWEHRWPKDCL